MKTRTVIGAFITVITLVAVQVGEAAVKYVNCGKATNGGGSSWADAYNTIQAGVNGSAAYGQLWVTGTCNVTGAITVDRAVQIFGGFAGTEAALSERKWTQNVTTVNAGGVNGRRCFLVTANDARIDGFTITGGRATDYAGGVHFYIAGYGPFTTTYLNNCRIYGNTGGSGGGVSSLNSHVLITNCTIYNNTAADGAGVYAYVYAVSIVNSTIYGNTAQYEGGGYRSMNILNPASVIVNSVVYGNSSSNSNNTLKQIYYTTGCPIVSYTNVTNGWSYAGCGSNNFNLTPGFVNAGAWDFHLTSSSVLKDIGNNTPADYQGWYVFFSGATDFEGDGRQYGTKIDLGADEYTPDTQPPAGTISINTGAAYTNSTTVTVTNSVSDPSGVSHMCLSETTCPMYPTSPWETFAATKVMTLSGDDGTKTVNAWFRDNLGNITSAGSPLSDTIILDTVKPEDGILAVTEDVAQIVLKWFGFSDLEGIASYKLVSSTVDIPPDCSGSALYLGTDTSYTHAVGPGTYYYRVCALDNAGNISSGAWMIGGPGGSPARVLRTLVPYTSLQAAYDAAEEGDVIQARWTFFVENLDLNKAISVVLDGGYEVDYSGKITNCPTTNCATYVCGSVIIGSNSGAVIIDKFEIWPGP